MDRGCEKFFDYYYGVQAEQYSFYRIPKVLFTDPVFLKMSTDSKALYGILLDRMSLSAKNGWLDENGRVFIIFTVNEITEKLGCSERTAVRLLNELENEMGLIERKRRGLGKPNVLYVKNFVSGMSKVQVKKCQNGSSYDDIKSVLKVSDLPSNNTDKNKTESSETDSILSDPKNDEMERYNAYQIYVKEQIGYEALCSDDLSCKGLMDEIVLLMTEVFISGKKYLQIGGEDKPISIVKSQFTKINMDHIRYVMECMDENTTKIRNIRAYLLSALYNAPSTMEHYYLARVNHDMAEGKG